MDAPKTVTIEMVRDAMRSFCIDGASVTNAQLYDLLGLTCEPEKDRLRTRINGMVKQGEVEKVGPGKYEYNFSFRLRENKNYGKIWRFIRSQKPGWTYSEMSQLIRIHYTQVCRYCRWLEEEGFIDRHSRNGQSITYRGTDRAMITPETPYPPLRETDPFEKEKAAAARIARLMLCNDPYAINTAREIVAACGVLLARFEKNQQQNGGEDNVQ